MGFERIKHRGDRFFLDGDYHGAEREYQRARDALPALDPRWPTLDALIKECAVRTGTAVTAPAAESPLSWYAASAGDSGSHFVPDMKELLELAIAGKSPARASLYRGLGAEFEAGYVALVQGEAHRATELLELASRRVPAAFVIHLELGRALSMTGNMSGARVELEKAVVSSPDDLEALGLLAAVHIELHQYSDAERILAPWVDREDTGPEVSFLFGRSLAGQGKRQEALARFRQAVERDPSFPDAYFEAARLLRQETDGRGALQLLRQACSILPDEVQYNRELATLVLERDLDVATGLAACDRLMVTDEQNRWQYLAWIAELYLRRGWRREAIDPLRKAIALVPREKTRESLDLRNRLLELESGAKTGTAT